ncbi:MAG: quinolinate synthase NadA [Zetaproteobacteria bacterium]|nr:MAG: quinolinate synthase NadA [Zetaproteobacteria bacterium]
MSGIDELYRRPDEELLQRIAALKERLGDRVLILGHHYQREEVFAFADVSGDSLKLAQHAAATDVPHIIFCGVHFMAETADILTGDDQHVILPDPAAGCSMADMADGAQVEACWRQLAGVLAPEEEVTPVTYINSTAELKAFCGEHGGVVCTSGNAERVMRWAWDAREKILFFPDRHLGENTALAMGLEDEEMALWRPEEPLGGNTPEQIRRARLILWDGFCSVHQLFRPEHVDAMRAQHPDIEVLAHPECSRTVCAKADFVGSTEMIIRHVRAAEPGRKFAIATELNLVNRLRLQHPEKAIWFLSPMVCMCSTMFRTDPQHLLQALEDVAAGRPGNRITVPPEIARPARVALERMLTLG